MTTPKPSLDAALAELDAAITGADFPADDPLGVWMQCAAKVLRASSLASKERTADIAERVSDELIQTVDRAVLRASEERSLRHTIRMAAIVAAVVAIAVIAGGAAGYWYGKAATMDRMHAVCAQHSWDSNGRMACVVPMWLD